MTSAAVPSGRHFRREVGLIGLMFVSEGSIIGSGWLFGALYAANTAGPAAIIAWIIGSIALILLALTYAELGAMYPVAGGPARFPHYAYGSLTGFMIGWATWIAAIGTAPIEVEAALQYATNYLPWLTYTSGGSVALTLPGYIVAAALMLLFTVINVLGVRRFSDTNTVITWWKILVPVIAIIVLMVTAFHSSNFTAGGGFAPFGAKGVLNALATSGVIFGLLGFETAVALAGESRNPRRDIPIAVVGAMIVGTIIYIFLQVAFIGALPVSSLAHGWPKVGLTGHTAIAFGPFAGIAGLLGLGWLAFLLYADAIVSPGGTGLVYTAYSSRLWYALARNGYLPPVFGRLSERGVPIFSIAVSFVVGMIIFLPFPGWHQLVGFISSATVLAYAMTPLALAALRRQEPDQERPYRLPAGEILAPLAFIIANLIIYWTGWQTDWKIFVAVGAGLIILAASYVSGSNPNRPPLDWRAAIWLWPYIGGMAIISYLGSFGGGRNLIPFGVADTVVVAAFSLVIYAFALRVRLPADRVQEYVGQIQAITEGEPEEIPMEVPGPSM